MVDVWKFSITPVKLDLIGVKDKILLKKPIVTSTHDQNESFLLNE